VAARRTKSACPRAEGTRAATAAWRAPRRAPRHAKPKPSPSQAQAKPSQAKQRLSAGRAALAKGGRPPRGGSWRAERRGKPLARPVAGQERGWHAPLAGGLIRATGRCARAPGLGLGSEPFAADAAFMPGGLRPSAAALKAAWNSKRERVGAGSCLAQDRWRRASGWCGPVERPRR